jgi:hypothetical protein
MKYFTPELYVRSQSSDDDVLDQVDQLWQLAGESYAAYLDTVRAEFPAGLQQLDNRFYLHDAEVRGMARRGASFIITVQIDTPPQSLVTLIFDLVEEPSILKAVFPAEWCSSARVTEWLYDEWEMVPGISPTWAISILLSNGWEVRLRFRDVEIQEAEALLPPPQSSSITMPALADSRSAP